MYKMSKILNLPFKWKYPLLNLLDPLLNCFRSPIELLKWRLEMGVLRLDSYLKFQ